MTIMVFLTALAAPAAEGREVIQSSTPMKQFRAVFEAHTQGYKMMGVVLVGQPPDVVEQAKEHVDYWRKNDPRWHNFLIVSDDPFHEFNRGNWLLWSRNDGVLVYGSRTAKPGIEAQLRQE